MPRIPEIERTKIVPTPRRRQASPRGHEPGTARNAASELQAPSEFGTRLRKYREERGLTLSGLAAESGLSKGYISSLENNHEARRPSGDVMYRLAQALGVTMADLLGRQLLPAASPTIPESLATFAKEEGLNQADVAMLASIKFRGEQPKTPDRWRYIYQSIRNSIQMDK
jgi:transcriptional regulator with XRE-family HTH domain